MREGSIAAELLLLLESRLRGEVEKAMEENDIRNAVEKNRELDAIFQTMQALGLSRGHAALSGKSARLRAEYRRGEKHVFPVRMNMDADRVHR